MNKNSLEHAESRLAVLEGKMSIIQEFMQNSLDLEQNYQDMIQLLISQNHILHKRIELLENQKEKEN